MLCLFEIGCHVELQSGESQQAAPASPSDPESVRRGSHCCPLSEGQAHPHLQQAAWCCWHTCCCRQNPPALPTGFTVAGPLWCRCGPMVDLCTGPHLPSTGFLKAQAVSNLSRAFWRADAKKDPLQVRHLNVTEARVSAIRAVLHCW